MTRPLLRQDLFTDGYDRVKTVIAADHRAYDGDKSYKMNTKRISETGLSSRSRVLTK